MAQTQRKYQVQVTDMERFTDKGNLKAYADIKVGKSLRIFGCRVIQQPGQEAWVSPPQRSWQDKEGKTKYSPVVEVSGELKEEIQEAVLRAWVEA